MTSPYSESEYPLYAILLTAKYKYLITEIKFLIIEVVFASIYIPFFI